ncbi:MAG: sulfotransferase domain-containing protein [Thermodesulfobacteriota bacterium]|nr:sulfotransferase domain-containing protein [Thermodesulfobacteriota bacterium]
MGTKKPILVTGSHRSGTTWIGRTISQAPRVRYIHEPFNIVGPNKFMGLKLDTGFSHYQSSSQKAEIESSFNDLLQWNPLRYAVKSCKFAGIDIKTPLRFAKHLLFESLLRPRILVKDPLALLSAGWLHETYDFKVIVMIRNPFAFVGSVKKAGWDFDFHNLRKQKALMHGLLIQFHDAVESICMKGASSDLIDRNALLWNILHFVILEYQHNYPEWLFVKYEDIAMAPKSGFHKIFDYLGIPLNSPILKYIEQYTSDKNPTDPTSTNYQPRNAKLSLTTWKERLSNEEIERVGFATSHISSQFYEKII